jgi:hypothetical protein
MDTGTDPLEAAQQVCVIAERQIGVQAVDDVDFGERLIRAPAKLVPRLLERHRVCLGHARLQPRERAEQAAGLADVGRLEAQVVVEVGARAVALFALAIGQPSDGKQIVAFEQTHALVEGQPFGRLQLVVDVGQTGRAKA